MIDIKHSPSLRDGRSIRTVSALLLQLVQTSTHDVSVEALGICKMSAQAAMRQKERPSDNTGSAFLDETDIEVGSFSTNYHFQLTH